LIDLEAGFTAKSKKEFTPSAPVEELVKQSTSEPSSPVKDNAETNVKLKKKKYRND
jgi:hypothetical protein